MNNGRRSSCDEWELMAKADLFRGRGLSAIASGDLSDETLDLALNDILKVIDKSYVVFGRITAEQRTMFALRDMILAERKDRGMPDIPVGSKMETHDMWERKRNPSYV